VKSVITKVQLLAFSASFYLRMYLSRGCLKKLIKHVRTGLETRPGFQSHDRSGGTALESRPHMFNVPWNPWRFSIGK
jgi:hypothetical protein